MNDDLIITPSVSVEDIYDGEGAVEFVSTPPGSYRMALAGEAKIKKTQAGESKLQLFFKHVEPANRAQFKGVNLSVMLEGTDKNGKPKAKQFADVLAALGVAKEDIAAGKISVRAAGTPAEGEEWKGVTARLELNGDILDLSGKEAIIKVEANTYQGKTTTRGTAAYKAN